MASVSADDAGNRHGYYIVDIELKDGRVFKQVVIDSGFLTPNTERGSDPLF